MPIKAMPKLGLFRGKVSSTLRFSSFRAVARTEIDWLTQVRQFESQKAREAPVRFLKKRKGHRGSNAAIPAVALSHRQPPWPDVIDFKSQAYPSKAPPGQLQKGVSPQCHCSRFLSRVTKPYDKSKQNPLDIHDLLKNRRVCSLRFPRAVEVPCMQLGLRCPEPFLKRCHHRGHSNRRFQIRHVLQFLCVAETLPLV